MGYIIDTPDAIQKYRQKVLLSSLGLEIKGMTRRGRSVYSIIKEEYNLKGNKKKVYEQFKQLIEG